MNYGGVGGRMSIKKGEAETGVQIEGDGVKKKRRGRELICVLDCLVQVCVFEGTCASIYVRYGVFQSNGGKIVEWGWLEEGEKNLCEYMSLMYEQLHIFGFGEKNRGGSIGGKRIMAAVFLVGAWVVSA